MLVISTRLFEKLESLAELDAFLPSRAQLAGDMNCGHSTVTQAYSELAASGHIKAETAGPTKKVTILIGPQAGKTIRTMPRPGAAPKHPAEAGAVASSAPRPCCQWCEKLFTRTKDRASYCSKTCADAARSYGPLVTRRQVEARRKHVESQPRGCPTVEAFIAAGGSIYREPAPRWAGAEG